MRSNLWFIVGLLVLIIGSIGYLLDWFLILFCFWLKMPLRLFMFLGFPIDLLMMGIGVFILTNRGKL